MTNNPAEPKWYKRLFNLLMIGFILGCIYHSNLWAVAFLLLIVTDMVLGFTVFKPESEESSVEVIEEEEDIKKEYESYKEGTYVSHSAKICCQFYDKIKDIL